MELKVNLIVLISESLDYLTIDAVSDPRESREYKCE